MTERIKERGPWQAFADSEGNPVIASDDFEHDVWLRPHGDFADVVQKLAYCEEIARRLNQWQEEHGA